MMRYEKKYQILHLSKSAVEQIIRLHPAGFRKGFPDRQVNNIYFDTLDLQTCLHNMDGINQRKKFRLRWYGKNLKELKKPTFEIKIKHNELGRKINTAMPDTLLSPLSGITTRINKLNKTIRLYPTLLNSYERSYFITHGNKFRITIDWNMQFYKPLHKDGFHIFPCTKQSIILEVKYAQSESEKASTILKYLPFRQTKSSKYVTGISLFSN